MVEKNIWSILIWTSPTRWEVACVGGPSKIQRCWGFIRKRSIHITSYFSIHVNSKFNPHFSPHKKVISYYTHTHTLSCQVKTPFGFWCKQSLNFRLLAQEQEILQVKLAKTYNIIFFTHLLFYFKNITIYIYIYVCVKIFNYIL